MDTREPVCMSTAACVLDAILSKRSYHARSSGRLDGTHGANGVGTQTPIFNPNLRELMMWGHFGRGTHSIDGPVDDIKCLSQICCVGGQQSK